MEPITPDEYDGVVDQWKELQSFPWSRLLYTLSRFNIQRHLDKRPLRVLDVGGGNGTNSIYFARQGHSVTLLDYSPVMLSEARQAAQEQGVLERITFCQADVADIRDCLPGRQFDLVLCHLMIQFVPAPEKALQSICQLVAAGGLISVLEANRYAEVYRKAFQANDLSAALQLIGAQEFLHRWFNRLIPLFSSAEMVAILAAGGCEAVGEYGIRCLCDYLPNEPKYEAEYYQALETLELKLTDTYPYNLLARCYQVIAREPATVGADDRSPDAPKRRAACAEALGNRCLMPATLQAPSGIADEQPAALRLVLPR